MRLMSYIGLFLLIWLGTGFIMGLKGVFLDKVHTQVITEEQIERLRNKGRTERSIESSKKILSSKKTYIAFATLMGFIILYGDLKYFTKE